MGLPPVVGVVVLEVFGCSTVGGVGGDCFRRPVGIDRGCNSCSEGGCTPSKQRGLKVKSLSDRVNLGVRCTREVMSWEGILLVISFVPKISHVGFPIAPACVVS